MANAEGGAYIAAANFIPYNPNTVITGNPNQWFNPNMFHMQPMVQCPNNAALTCETLGDAARGILRGPDPGARDFSLVLLGKQVSVQFRTEIFNILNRTNFGFTLPAKIEAQQ